MSTAFLAERRLLAADEIGQVERSHYPLLEGLPKEEVVSLAQWLRARHGRARDLLRDRRRARRGKPAARPAPEGEEADRGLAAKKQVFAAGLKRVNARLGALAAAAKREANLAKLQAALARRQAGQAAHPDAGATPGAGMQSLPKRKPRMTISPGRIGSTSQAGKAAQARRDARG
jgi:hypothetical protein